MSRPAAPAPPRRLRRPARAAAVPMVLAAASLLGAWAAPAGAEAPTKVGWWNEANMGVAPPSPPSVPDGGLYVQNGPGGPMAVSAVEFSVPAGATVGQLKLDIAGSPVLTQPPVACPITGTGFTPAQNGAWAQKPTWDCSNTQVTGSVDSAKTSVTFDASKLSSGSEVAAVILAGGPADQVAFSPPGNDALTVTAPAQSSPPAADSSMAGAPAPTDSGGAATPSSTDFASGAGVDTSGLAGGAAALPAPAAAAPATPSVAGAQLPASAPRYGYRSYSPTSGGSRFPRSGVATGLGLVAMVVALAAYSQGFGPLGGRIQPLSARGGQRRRPGED